MTVVVMVTCDRDVGEGTCPTSALGRPGEDVDRTVERATRAGWRRAGAGTTMDCPWHATRKTGGTGPL